MGKYYLILYSQQTRRDGELTANGVTDKSPAKFLIDLINDYPECHSKLLWATEISFEHYEKLKDEL